jgi:transposase InsO family protein
MKSAGIKPIRLPPFSPNLNAFAENFVGRIKSECLNHIIFAGEKSLCHAVAEYVSYYQTQRNHQGLDNCIPFPEATIGCVNGKIKCKERLGGLLKYYCRAAA